MNDMTSQERQRISNPWLNIDDQANFDACVTKLKDVDTKNFAVQFDSAKALGCVDVNAAQVKQLLDEVNSKDNHSTHWINFWGWSQDQTASIDVITEQYGLSPRLREVLWPKAAPQSEHPKIVRPKGASADSLDIEKGEAATDSAPLANHAPDQTPTFAQLVDHLWHFYPVDRGERYLYIGFNSLFAVTGQATNPDIDKPTGQRIWTSLLLCDDGTVISVFENPLLGLVKDLKTIENIRQNVLNIFNHLSHLHLSAPSSSLNRVTIRTSDSGEPATAANRTEMTSLLFYYLFDDWRASYSLIIQREHRYRAQLENIRKQMLESAEVSLIESLHHLGRQLTILKLMYKSKEFIIQRILQRRRDYRHTTYESPIDFDDGIWYGSNVPADPEMMTGSLSHQHQSTTLNGSRGGHRVGLSFSAVMRFERLLDRIQLMPQTEIDECIREKESLTFMNFNLVALKESQAVERLTRTTILLAKVTILFLPVSLLTSYFSIQIFNIQKYSLKTYWLSFMVIFLLTILLLSITGVANSKVLGRTVYKSLTKIVWDKRREKKRS